MTLVVLLFAVLLSFGTYSMAAVLASRARGKDPQITLWDSLAAAVAASVLFLLLRPPRASPLTLALFLLVTLVLAVVPRLLVSGHAREFNAALGSAYDPKGRTPAASPGPWVKWMTHARAVADFEGRLFLSLFYFLVFAPLALIVRPTAQERPASDSQWQSCEEDARGLEAARRQF